MKQSNKYIRKRYKKRGKEYQELSKRYKFDSLRKWSLFFHDSKLVGISALLFLDVLKDYQPTKTYLSIQKGKIVKNRFIHKVSIIRESKRTFGVGIIKKDNLMCDGYERLLLNLDELPLTQSEYSKVKKILLIKINNQKFSEIQTLLLFNRRIYNEKDLEIAAKEMITWAVNKVSPSLLKGGSAVFEILQNKIPANKLEFRPTKDIDISLENKNNFEPLIKKINDKLSVYKTFKFEITQVMDRRANIKIKYQNQLITLNLDIDSSYAFYQDNKFLPIEVDCKFIPKKIKLANINVLISEKLLRQLKIRKENKNHFSNATEKGQDWYDLTTLYEKFKETIDYKQIKNYLILKRGDEIKNILVLFCENKIHYPKIEKGWQMMAKKFMLNKTFNESKIVIKEIISQTLKQFPKKKQHSKSEYHKTMENLSN